MQLYHKFNIPNVIVGVSSLVANSILIYLLRKENKLGTISYKFVLILCISDLISASLSITIEPIMRVTTHPKYHRYVRLFSVTSRFLVGTFSAMITVLIAVDRYIHLKYSQKYSLIMTARRAKIIVTTLLLVDFGLIGVLGTALMRGFYSEMFIAFSAVCLMMLISACVIYYNAYRSVVKQIKATDATNLKGVHNINKDFSRAVIFILGSLVVLYTPFIIFKPISLHYGKEFKWMLTVTYMAQTLALLNCTVNATLFIGLNGKLRKRLRHDISCC